MSRFFIKKEDVLNNLITLNKEDSNHIVKSLRLKIGSKIEATDGLNLYSTEIKSFSDNVVLKVIKVTKEENEPIVQIDLYQAVPKKGKFEYIIEKATEIGITNIVPLISERTIFKFYDNSWENKKKRFNKIALEAAKQSERGKVPRVLDYLKLKNFKNDYDLVVVAYAKEKNMIIDNLPNNNIKKIALFIGPEGGFTSNEINFFNDQSAKFISLGDLILKTDTAAIVSSALILNKYNIKEKENEK